MKDKTGAVDTYINGYDGEMLARLKKIRKLILAEAPKAVEVISYGLVGYKYNDRPMVYFGGFAHHIGFYATPAGHDAFKKELSEYHQGKGSVQLPLSKPLPLELIKKIVHYRMTQKD